MARTATRLFPALLKHWRGRRGLSQLDLALAADVSARHISFLETGRAQPSRDMLLRLASALSVPFRDQNAMLDAAGYPEAFGEPGLGEKLPKPISEVIDRMLAQHEPFPMTVLNRRYDVLRVNDAGMKILGRFVVDPAALPEPLNVFALLFDPRLGRSFVVDWEKIAHAMVARLHREALASPEDGIAEQLLRMMMEYPGVPPSWRQPDFSVPSDPVFTLHLRRDDLSLGFLTTVTAFNAPQNVTLEELRIESYFPLDDATARACEKIARD